MSFTPGLREFPRAEIWVESTDSDRPLEVYVAGSEASRRRGLSWKRELETDGMLFVYYEDVEQPFTMRDTYVPLTIFWFDVDGNCVGSADLDALDPTPVEPPSFFRYALEVPRGSLLGVERLRVFSGTT